MLNITLESPDGLWVLGPQSDAAAELALARVDAGGTVQVRVVDRCFVASGCRWIIDYKTVDLGAEVDSRM